MLRNYIYVLGYSYLGVICVGYERDGKDVLSYIELLVKVEVLRYDGFRYNFLLNIRGIISYFDLGIVFRK